MDRDAMVRILDEIAEMLDLKGENPFKSAAYRNGARTVSALGDTFDSLVETGALADVKGIGPALFSKITTLARTGTLPYYDELKASIPPGHFDLLRIPGMGPKKIQTLHRLLGIETLGELEYACRENRLAELKGFGTRTQAKLLEGIESIKRFRERRLAAEVLPQALDLLQGLKSSDAVVAASIAGSLRRGNEVVKDMDLLASTNRPETVAEVFTGLSREAAIVARGMTKVSLTLPSGINADLRIVAPGEFPYALHHFTGCRAHNTALRGRAKKMGLKMNEYGLFDSAGRRIPCEDETALFAALGLAFIPPELREDMGEIEAAQDNILPRLVEHGDIRGVLHVHTSASDGSHSLEELALEARRLGYGYLGVSDHSRSAVYAGGLTPEDIRRQHDLVDELNEHLAPFRIFKGIEADILPDGRLDYDEEILAEFDFVIAAVHSHFAMPEAQMTERVLTALAHPATTLLAHPTGRLLLAREPYAVHVPALLDMAAEKGKVLELNANPQRLDLGWRHLREAKRKGVPIAINPDIHRMDGFTHLAYGIGIARKGWLEASDCINCLNTIDFKAFLDRGHRRNASPS